MTIAKSFDFFHVRNASGILAGQGQVAQTGLEIDFFNPSYFIIWHGMRIAIVIILFVLSNPGTCQSFFYNTQQFGLKSTLLGGAVTAGSSDLSMVYYNPAALRYAKDKGFDLTLFMPSLSSYNYGDYFDSGEDLKSLNFLFNPSLITYKTSIKDFEVVFSILQKDIWNNGIEYSDLRTLNGLDKNESFKYRYKGDEKWFGLGSNFKLADAVSFGVSQFWSFLNTSYNYSISSETADSRGIRNSFFNENLILEYSSLFSMVTKIGISIDRPDDRIGVVVTTPNYRSMIKSASFDKSTSSFDAGSHSLTNTVNFDLDPTLKNGWQIDLGYAKVLSDSSEIWFNASMYPGVERHEIFRVQNVNANPLIFKGGTASIANFAVGYARMLSPNIQFLCSARTNLNAYHNVEPLDDSQAVIVLEQNRTQIALGCKVNHKNSSFVIGLDWGFAIDDSVDQFNRFPRIELFDRNAPRYTHHTITFLLTYEFFLDSMGKNISRILDRTPRRNKFH